MRWTLNGDTRRRAIVLPPPSKPGVLVTQFAGIGYGRTNPLCVKTPLLTSFWARRSEPCGCPKPHPAQRPGTMYQKERRYLPSDLRPARGSTWGETRSGWRPRNPGQPSNWSFRHPQGRAIVATVAWGTACETLGHADEFAGIHPSDLSVARAEVARAEVARTRDVFNEALAGIGLGPFLADDEQ